MRRPTPQLAKNWRAKKFSNCSGRLLKLIGQHTERSPEGRMLFRNVRDPVRPSPGPAPIHNFCNFECSNGWNVQGGGCYGHGGTLPRAIGKISEGASIGGERC